MLPLANNHMMDFEEQGLLDTIDFFGKIPSFFY
ncbi:hypothetical protein ACFWDG_19410 [Peribacillus sp. NPDC060186]